MHRAARSLNDLVVPEEQETVPLGDGNIKQSGLARQRWSFANLIDESFLNSEDKDKTLKGGKGGDGKKDDGSKEIKDGDYFALDTTKAAGRLTVLERFQNKLAIEVFTVLRKADEKRKSSKNKKDSGNVGLSLMDEESDSDEDDPDGETVEDILEQLFYNISSKVEGSVADRLQLKRADVYYYELVASYYGLEEHMETVEKRLLPLCVNLWSVEIFPAVFSLLMHRWVLKHDGEGKRGWLIRLNVLLKGTNQLFWFDTKHKTHRLLSLFCYIRNKLKDGGGSNSRGLIDNVRKRTDFTFMLCRFYYYYRSSKIARVEEFLDTVNIDLDTFVLESVTQLSAVGGNADTLQLHYLQCLERLAEYRKPDLENRLSRTAYNKLHTTLNAFVLPGAPFHPSLNVRNKARSTMAVLFPHGQWSRSAINFGFKLLRPNYWISELSYLLNTLWESLMYFMPGRRAKTA